MNFTFDKPIYLWLILLLPILYWSHYYFLHKTQTKAMHFANFMTIKRIADEKFVTKNTTILILRSLILLVLILSLSQATFWYTGAQSEFDYVFAIDTSASMATKDIIPTRFDVAKESAVIFLDAIEGQVAYGLVTFSGVTFIVSPLTEDKFTLGLTIQGLNITKNGGTDLANAIITSTNLLSSSNKGRVVLLFTDGSNTVSSSIDGTLNQAISYAKSKQIQIHSIGLGTNSAPVGYLPELYGLESSIDRETLEFISSSTGGKTIYPANTGELNDFLRDVVGTNKQGEIPIKFASWGIILAFILLCVEWILINTLFRRVV